MARVEGGRPVNGLERKGRNFSKKLWRAMFVAGQKFGFDILPKHYYSEIANIENLKRDDAWKKPYSMAGVEGREKEGQLAFVAQCCSPALVERQKKGDIYSAACAANGAEGYGPVEADFLHCFVATRRPARIVQVGCGVSTAVILKAASEAGYRPEIVCVDPYPGEYLRNCPSIRLVAQKAESVPLETFTGLRENDLLFIDSTHALKPGGEVPRLVLEALPRMAHGAWVHFHDIYFPYDYPRDILDEALFFPHESVLLHAFLVHNARYAVRASLSMLHYSSREELVKYLPNYRPAEDDCGLRRTAGHFPSSVYLQATG